MPLTPREKQIAGLVTLGYTDLEIAKILGLKKRSIKTHLNNIYKKTDLTNKVGNPRAVLAARVMNKEYDGDA